jgi:peptidyl-dipeptidase Dcp
MNPLLEDFNTAPFSKISSTDYKPAIKKAIDICKKEIETIISNPETSNFKNTTEALEFTGQKLGRITSIFFNLNSAETSEAIQKIAQEISPWLSEFKNDMILNSALFKKVKSVYDIRKNLNLDPEQTVLLEKQYKGFSRNGANLNDEDKEKLRKIDTELSKLSLQFGENVLADGNAFKLHIIHEKDLKGLPDGAKEAARLLAKNRNKEGWLITLDYPSYIPFITYAENRELRKKTLYSLWKKRVSKQ